MLKSEEFIDISQITDIESFVTKLIKNETKIQLWQKEDTFRTQTKGHIVKFCNDERSIIIEASQCSSDGFENFDYREIYIYSPIRSLIFKSKVQKIKDGKYIKIDFPTLAKIEEARREERKYYGMRSYQSLDLSLSHKPNSNLSFLITNISILDSSENGLGFLVPIVDATTLKINQEVKVVKCTLTDKVERVGVIKSLVKRRNNLSGETYIRVGIELI